MDFTCTSSACICGVGGNTNNKCLINTGRAPIAGSPWTRPTRSTCGEEDTPGFFTPTLNLSRVMTNTMILCF